VTFEREFQPQFRMEQGDVRLARRWRLEI